MMVTLIYLILKSTSVSNSDKWEAMIYAVKHYYV